MLKRECERSLELLRVDRIDLFQLHTVDRSVPYEESVGALAELQQEGKIRLVGLSNVDLDHLRRARELVEVASVQNRYNLWDRGSEQVLEECEASGIAFIPWAPIAARRTTASGCARWRTTSRRRRRRWRSHRSCAARP